ncbi:MAG: hypothetical protein OEW09_10690 [Anaerolineae bacterium]|nr:hypothetical protein [Anaerolineae bacterium]
MVITAANGQSPTSLGTGQPFRTVASADQSASWPTAASASLPLWGGLCSGASAALLLPLAGLMIACRAR